MESKEQVLKKKKKNLLLKFSLNRLCGTAEPGVNSITQLKNLKT
jgi:hypothetical protein